MSARLAARLEVDALRRLAEAAGGHATVLARGDPDSGIILAVLVARDGSERVCERTPAFAGSVRWDVVGSGTIPADYLARRRRSDPDLWAIELSDLADPDAILAQLTG